MRAGLTVVALLAAQLIAPTMATLSATARADTAVSDASNAIARTTSPNWAGYVVESSHRFTAVTGTWTVPAVNCAAAKRGAAAAIWVGLDGFRDQTVEQIGLKVTCSDVTRYTAWWQMWPAPVHRLADSAYPVHPGDVLTATVARTGRRYTLVMTSSAGWHIAVVRHGSAKDSSAEWVASSPRRCPKCQYVALANFGRVAFSDARAATGGHLRGVMSFAAHSARAHELTMDGPKDVVRARPSTVSTVRSSFVVTWKHA